MNEPRAQVRLSSRRHDWPAAKAPRPKKTPKAAQMVRSHHAEVVIRAKLSAISSSPRLSGSWKDASPRYRDLGRPSSSRRQSCQPTAATMMASAITQRPWTPMTYQPVLMVLNTILTVLRSISTGGRLPRPKPDAGLLLAPNL